MAQALIITGAVALVVGAALVWTPLAWLTYGVLALAGGIDLTRRPALRVPRT